MTRRTSSPKSEQEDHIEPGAIVVEEDGDVRGTVRISPRVLTELVELTVQDIAGVASVQGKRRVAAFLPFSGSENDDDLAPIKDREHGGIRVRVKGHQFDADVTVLATSEVNIPELGRSIQAKISTAVERVLGMSAGAINVHVAGIQNPESTH